MVLDALFVQASPPGSFEVMQVGALGKAAFHQIASTDTVPPRFLAPGLLDGFIQEFLSQVPLESTTRLGFGAAFPQQTL